MADRPKNTTWNWLESEEEIWSGFRKWERFKRDLLWLLIGLVLMVIGSITGFPGRLFISPGG